MTTTVPLTRGDVAVIDDADVDVVGRYNWHTHISLGKKYAAAKVDGARVFMHRLLLGCERDEEVDHADGDGLNNTRANIRICTRRQNQQNRGKFKNNRSGYCGVYQEKYQHSRGKRVLRAKPWRAEISANGKKHYIGYFSTPEEAAIAYDQAAANLHGLYAKTNASMGLIDPTDV